MVKWVQNASLTNIVQWTNLLQLLQKTKLRQSHEILFFFFFQIWYEVTCDIAEDTELLLGPKVPLLISDMRREVDDRSGSGM